MAKINVDGYVVATPADVNPEIWKAGDDAGAFQTTPVSAPHAAAGGIVHVGLLGVGIKTTLGFIVKVFATVSSA